MAHPLLRRLGPPPHDVVARQVSAVFAVGTDLLRTVWDSPLVTPKALDYLHLVAVIAFALRRQDRFPSVVSNIVR